MKWLAIPLFSFSLCDPAVIVDAPPRIDVGPDTGDPLAEFGDCITLTPDGVVLFSPDEPEVTIRAVSGCAGTDLDLRLDDPTGAFAIDGPTTLELTRLEPAETVVRLTETLPGEYEAVLEVELVVDTLRGDFASLQLIGIIEE